MSQLPFANVLRVALSCLLVLCVAGCSLTKVGRQTAELDRLSTLEGMVDNETLEAGPVHVLLFRHTDMGFEPISRQPLFSDGSYLFYVEPGNYGVGAFIDVDGDGEYFGSEPASYIGEEQAQPKIFQVGKGESHTVPLLVVDHILVRQPDHPVVEKSTLSSSNVGRMAALSDDRFSAHYSTMGLWHPVDFVDEIGAGLFMLQPFEEGKIPVVFIHGINGSPANFSDVIAALDLDDFQPWVLHYPSGVPLDMVSIYLLRSLDQLQTEYQFPGIYVVAHSMGGLMTRSFVMLHQEKKSDIELGLVVTINSPLYGMDSAATGVRTSPVVLPAWRDVASNSDYVKRVHSFPWPPDIPYHLVFSYKDGEDGDGVVPMRSQLSRSLQQEARQIHGFNAEHSGILKKQDFILELNRILVSP